ncbi:SMP-30/gluconolactonase/LRE family protein [Paracraurococcus lichenis]|uniref:SMP-30/Gluconolactonase/LRE-like region domain-containing protein n=1 Tax=Paracraurococcus lichenis TaxID=3064888 RepID=A0ABT9EBE2_9PROT|nr:hypothetical protein [Paracraurococcus sp. LOR1-02]MDO9713273.1 hypothetical protein [Paracraurococcus sp. LOR1-02]
MFCKAGRIRRLGAILTFALLGAAAPSGSRAADVVVPGRTDFPESMTATRDGTLYFSSMAGGRVFRAQPGATEASEWLSAGAGGLSSVLGILADERSSTLYACSVDMSWAGITVPSGNTPTSLKLFDLATGTLKASFQLPASPIAGQAPLCNDIAVANDGIAFVTDSLSGYILRLRPGANALEVWARDERWNTKGPQLDGIAVLDDGSVYVNLFEGDGLFRVSRQSDGSAGKVTKLATSRPLYHSDGLRAAGPNTLLMVEGETKGTLDLITIQDDNATVQTIRGGLEGPVSLAQVGNTIYVLDVPLKYLFEPQFKAQTPPPYRAIAVPQPR